MRTLRREGQCGGCVGVVLAQHQHQTNIKQTIRSIYLLVVSIYLLITGRMSMTLADGNCEINGREGGAGPKVVGSAWAECLTIGNSIFD